MARKHYKRDASCDDDWLGHSGRAANAHGDARENEGEEKRAYRRKSGDAEASAAIKPVVITQLIDLDALLIRRRMRHRLCHHQRLGVLLGGDVVASRGICAEIGS